MSVAAAAVAGRLLLLLSLLLAFAGCGGTTGGSSAGGSPATAPSAATAAEAATEGYVAAVLVAGSDEQGVFDNARRTLARELDRVSRLPPRIVMLSARRDVVASGEARPATLAELDAAFDRAAPGAAACLLFATSHGTPRGFVLTYRDELLTPAELDRVLDRDCGDKPTIVIVSACFSGIFAAPPMPADNRIILTAAARDRTSFGCSNDLTYTYFDEALLKLLPQAQSWPQLYADLQVAITARERSLDERPSRPQASFGAAVPRDELLIKAGG